MSPPLPHTAFVFPGQGSQAVGMGKDLVEGHESARRLFERADAVLGYSLSTLCFEGPEEELKKTENTQPALYLVSCATLDVLREQGVGTPQCVAGHSLGEYSALYAAGVFDFETGLRLVRARGLAMAEAGANRPGAMSAVMGLDGKKVDELCRSVSGEGGLVVAANFNAPDQTVISGDSAGVSRAGEAIKQAGAKRVLPLPVSGAFHSPLVEAASVVMRGKLAQAQFSAPSIRFINNADAQFLTDADAIRDSLVRQIISPVRWVEIIEALWAAGCRRFIEVGSGKVLAGLIGRIQREAQVLGTPSAEALQATITALKTN